MRSSLDACVLDLPLEAFLKEGTELAGEKDCCFLPPFASEINLEQCLIAPNCTVYRGHYPSLSLRFCILIYFYL